MLTRGAGNGPCFEFECDDTAHLYNLAHFLDRKLATPPLSVQTIYSASLAASAPTPMTCRT
ncbi:MAG: hypothetical protein NVS2B4_04330 [Ramlibacter sp.]